MLYSPSVFTVVERSKPFSTSRMVTLALVIRLPFASFTMTCKSPVAALCPKQTVLSERTISTSKISFEADIGISYRDAREYAGRDVVNAKTGGLWQARMWVVTETEGFISSRRGESKRERAGGTVFRTLKISTLHLRRLCRELPMWPVENLPCRKSYSTSWSHSSSRTA